MKISIKQDRIRGTRVISNKFKLKLLEANRVKRRQKYTHLENQSE